MPRFNWCASVLVLVLLCLSTVKHVRGQSAGDEKREVYFNHEEMTAFLRNMSANYPNLTRLYSIGKSVQSKSRVNLPRNNCPIILCTLGKQAEHFLGGQYISVQSFVCLRYRTSDESVIGCLIISTTIYAG